jgi:simple sugar transport system permease protein
MNESIQWMPFLVAVAAGAVARGTPIALAALGEAISEKSGVMNLGVEGMMLVGALTGFVVQFHTGNPSLAIIGAGVAAAMLASVHAALVLLCDANQVVSGFALTILGTGLTGFFGRPYVGVKIKGVGQTTIPVLRQIPYLGEILFQQDLFVYLAMALAVASWFLLYRTRFGLNVRAVGEDPEPAFAQGVAVRGTRFLAVIMGGFLAGVGGAHLSVATTQVWAERMTSGQGWIAIGLVIVARWRPIPCLITAWVFGALLVLHPYLQSYGIEVSPYLIGMIPYLAAVVGLVVVTVIYRRSDHGMPTSLARQLNLPE